MVAQYSPSRAQSFGFCGFCGLRVSGGLRVSCKGLGIRGRSFGLLVLSSKGFRIRGHEGFADFYGLGSKICRRGTGRSHRPEFHEVNPTKRTASALSDPVEA